MKYKLFSIGLTLAMLAAIFGLSAISTDQNFGRIHQHQIVQKPNDVLDEDSTLSSHLPLVEIDTGGQIIPGFPLDKTDRFGEATYALAENGNLSISANLAIIDHLDTVNRLTDTPTLVSKIEIHIRGNDTRNYPKSSYQLSFVDESKQNRNLPVMGMSPHHEWVLYGPVIDRTMIRNYMWYNIAGEIMNYAPNVRFCELVLDGDYRGLYLMTESITEGDEGRLNLSQSVINNLATGYLLRVDRPTEVDLDNLSDVYTYAERMGLLLQDISLIYPGNSDLSPELSKSIEIDVSAFEKALYSFDYNNPLYGYRTLIDVQNFVDYFILNEVSGNMEAGLTSTYLYKLPGGKFQLCVWDFDNVADNSPGNIIPTQGFSMMDSVWFFMLVKDQYFVNQIIHRYQDLRQSILSDAYLENYIDATLTYLGPAIERNENRWETTYSTWNPFQPAERFPQNHQIAILQMKTWMKERATWLDANIQVLNQYSHPSANKNYNH